MHLHACACMSLLSKLSASLVCETGMSSAPQDCIKRPKEACWHRADPLLLLIIALYYHYNSAGGFKCSALCLPNSISCLFLLSSAWRVGAERSALALAVGRPQKVLDDIKAGQQFKQEQIILLQSPKPSSTERGSFRNQAGTTV